MLEQRHLVKQLSRMRPAASRNWLKALRALLDFAVAEGFRPDNPAAAIKFRKYKAKSHHAWTAEEIEQFEAYWPIGSKPRLALALLLHTAQRRGDVVRMGAAHPRQWHLCEAAKDRSRIAGPYFGGAARRAAEDASASLHIPDATENGTPYKPGEFKRWFRRQCNAAGSPGIASRTASDMPPPLGWPRRGRARTRSRRSQGTKP